MGGSPLGIIGSIAGAALSSRNASRASDAFERANAMNREGFEMVKPYLSRLYKDGTAALDDILNTGYYQGPTYAGLTDAQREAAKYATDFARNNLGLGQNFMDMGSSFAEGYKNLYDRANQDSLKVARDYATANAQPLIDAAMLNSRRQLEESTLPTINQAASASRNTNSSRAGVQDALARRAYDDRYAQTATDIQDKLMARSLTQSQNDFQNLASATDALKGLFGLGVEFTPAMLDQIQRSEGILQNNAQRELDAQRAFFEGNRDFNYDALNSYGAGILGQAPRTPTQVTPNYFDPLMSGALGGLGGFGAGMRLGNMFNSPTRVSPTVQFGYNGGFNPSYLNSSYYGGMI